MLLNSNICATSHTKILWFRSSCNRLYVAKFGASQSGIHFPGNPFTYIVLFSTTDSPRFNSNPKLYLQNGNSDYTGDGCVVKEELGVKKCKVLSFSDTCFTDDGKNCSYIHNASTCSFDHVHEFEESDNEDLDCTDDDFKVLDSFGKTQKQVNGAENGGISGRIEEEMGHHLVKETCRLIEHRSAWNPQLEIELRRLLRSMKPHQVCAALTSQSDERIALKFFYWADQQWRYRHDPIVYYVMLQLLSRTKLCQGAKRILKLMARRRIPRRPEDFGCVMVAFSRAGHLRKAMQILNVMQRAGIEPDLSICNTAIYVLVKGDNIEKALSFLERMQLVGITPNVVTYNCLIKGYCDVHRVEDALELIAEMPYKGCYPDKVNDIHTKTSIDS